MSEALCARVTYREAMDAVDVLMKAATAEDKKVRDRRNDLERLARAEALRRVAEWVEQEARRDG